MEGRKDIKEGRISRKEGRKEGRKEEDLVGVLVKGELHRFPGLRKEGRKVGRKGGRKEGWMDGRQE